MERCELALPSCRSSQSSTPLQAIKGLREKFDETRASFGPRTRFTFKTARRNFPVNGAEPAAQEHRDLSGKQSLLSEHHPEGQGSSTASILRTPPTTVDKSQRIVRDSEEREHTNLNPQAAATRSPAFSKSSTVSIIDEPDSHIILPPSALHKSKLCSLTSLSGCIVDLSVLSPQDNASFASLTVKNIRTSLLVCGNVSGPAHITAVEDSVIAVKCRQFRMHECRNVDVYLSCSSRPIIEDCSGIRFAPIPNTYVNTSFTENQISEHC